MKNDQAPKNMTRESLLKVYVGNKPFGLHYPVLVVVGDNSWEKTFFSEHFIFSDFPKLPFVYRRDVVSPKDARPEYFDFNAYPEIFSAESLLKNQITTARAHLEFEFSECEYNPLARFYILGKYAKEMDFMFDFSRSKQLRELKEKLSKLPRIKIDEDLGDWKP